MISIEKISKDILVLTKIGRIMKRKIGFMNSGNRHDGTTWYVLVFACQFDAKTATLYKEESVFVAKEVYDAVSVGQEITVK